MLKSGINSGMLMPLSRPFSPFFPYNGITSGIYVPLFRTLSAQFAEK